MEGRMRPQMGPLRLWKRLLRPWPALPPPGGGVCTCKWRPCDAGGSICSRKIGLPRTEGGICGCRGASTASGGRRNMRFSRPGRECFPANSRQGEMKTPCGQGNGRLSWGRKLLGLWCFFFWNGKTWFRICIYPFFNFINLENDWLQLIGDVFKVDYSNIVVSVRRLPFCFISRVCHARNRQLHCFISTRYLYAIGTGKGQRKGNIQRARILRNDQLGGKLPNVIVIIITCIISN